MMQLDSEYLSEIINVVNQEILLFGQLRILHLSSVQQPHGLGNGGRMLLTGMNKVYAW